MRHGTPDNPEGPPGTPGGFFQECKKMRFLVRCDVSVKIFALKTKAKIKQNEIQVQNYSSCLSSISLLQQIHIEIPIAIAHTIAYSYKYCWTIA